MSAELVGGRLGKYEVRAEIGRGGMGTVYLGHDPMLYRQVAIKVLAPHLVWEPGFVERFLREARAAARLRHPNIVTIYDVGQEGTQYYFVMEFIEGQTLAQVIKQQGALPPAQVMTILRSLASALDQAHGQGLVHRDIKPGNIMVGPTGQVILTDFGIARAAQEVGLTRTGTLVGTPEYMSPEQARGDAVDARTDQYSLGVVAYEMLSGEVPFSGTTPHGVLYRQIHEPPPPIGQIRPDLPPGVQTVLQQALAKEPGERYDTVTAFAQALGQALAGEAVETAADVPTLLVGQAEEPATAPATTPPPQEPAPAKEAADVPTLLVGQAEEPAAASATTPPPREPAPAKAAAAEPAAVKATKRRGSRRPWLLAGLALLIAAGVLVGVILLLGGGGQDRATSTPVAAAGAKVSEPTAPSPTPHAESEQPEALPQPERPFECPDPVGCVDVAPGEPVRIGYLLATRAEDPVLGLDSQRGLELALADREVLGHPLELVGQDTGCEPESAVAGAERLAAAPEVVAVVGPSCSDEAWAAVPILCGSGLAVVSPSASAPGLTSEDRPGELWCFLRTGPNDAALSSEAARFARESLRLDRAATVQDDSAHAEQVQATFAGVFTDLGGTVAAQEWVGPGADDVGPPLQHIVESQAQFIYLSVTLEAGAGITMHARQVPGLEGVPLMGISPLFTPELFGRVGDAALGFLWAQPEYEFGPPAWELEARYTERYGEPPLTTSYANAYDAMTLVLVAVDAAAVQDDDGTLHIGRGELLEVLHNIRDLEGVTGPLACRPTGDCVETRVAIYEAVDTHPDHWNPGPDPENNPRKIWP